MSCFFNLPNLFFTLIIFTVVNLAYFSSMPELEQLPPLSGVYECAYPNITGA